MQAPDGNKPTHRVLLVVGGGCLLLIGTAMLVLPGPGVIVISLGFALLARRFWWAKRGA